ncbi:MAG: M48 family metalloprotease [Acidobacteriota bacterium]|nr:M48 family metalloprotease [Acidobacteriota bacterium]
MGTPRWTSSAAAMGRGLLAFVSIALVACALNPATGRKQLSFFSESYEIELGAEVDREFLTTSREYEDAGLHRYVAELGGRLAAVSERPDLPWTFRLADDEIVNAFALPGGRIYVTRGLLAHLNREAELAGVLGHEIGHVSARHAVNGLSRELAITAGVLAGLALFDVDDDAQAIAALGLGLLFLKFGRNQERQADELGVRYAERAGLDPWGVVDVLRVLEQVSRAQGDGWFPVWLSTHPDPEGRWQRLAAETGLDPAPRPGAVQPEVDAFLDRLDGLVYGPDPRHGVIRGNVYVHLRDRFQWTLPAGWEVERQGQMVAAGNAEQNGQVVLLPRLAATEREAAAAFAAEDGVRAGESWDENLGGLAARLVRFDGGLDGEEVRGLAAFVRTPARVVSVLGVSASDSWSRNQLELERSVRSIGRVADPQHRAAAPDRLAIVTLDRSMTVGEIARRYSPQEEPAVLALLNQVDVDAPLPAGRRVKTIRAGR